MLDNLLDTDVMEIDNWTFDELEEVVALFKRTYNPIPKVPYFSSEGNQDAFNSETADQSFATTA